MKPLILLFFVTTYFIYGVSTTAQIKNSKKNLSQTSYAKKKASYKLSKIAKDIKSVELEINNLNKKLEKLSIQKQKNELKYNNLKNELVKSNSILEKNNEEIKQKYNTFVSLLSEQFSVIFAMKKFNLPTQKTIISNEIYNVYKKNNKEELKKLREEINLLKKKNNVKRIKRDNVKKIIAQIDNTRKLYIKEKKRQKKLKGKLNSIEEKYQAKLQELSDKQNSLRNTLAKLNILHTKEVKESQRREKLRLEAIRQEKVRLRKIRKARALALKKEREAKAAMRIAKTAAARKAAEKKALTAKKELAKAKKRAGKTSDRIRKVNSSYHQGSIASYTGNKTISPISGAYLIKKFGTYTDPIYKIKIFNESITLKAPKRNAKVKNVLNGKVVFAGKSSMLGKVVVVAHKNKMHTVYAGLSKIAPTIHVGTRIQKGYVVGRVLSKLIFQATRNSKHINPVKLIRI